MHFKVFVLYCIHASSHTLLGTSRVPDSTRHMTSEDGIVEIDIHSQGD